MAEACENNRRSTGEQSEPSTLEPSRCWGGDLRDNTAFKARGASAAHRAAGTRVSRRGGDASAGNGRQVGAALSVLTTTKSSWHHGSRRYECLWPTKP
jgi:hypothetical protein